MTGSIDRYTVLALQTRCDAANNLNKLDERTAMMAAITLIDDQIRGSFVLTGPSLKH